MKKTDFFDIVEQPGLLNENSLTALNEIVDEFPWFQTARMLLVKNLHSIEHVRFNSELKQSAAFIADRKRLYELIHKKKTEIVHKQSHEEVTNVPTSTPTVKEIEAQPKGSVGITTKVSSIVDYFQTDDTFETADGGQIDFSLMSDSKQPVEEKTSMILPSADFLGYESPEISGYQLKESINTEEKKDESHSFSDWLTMMRHASVNKEEKPVKKKSHQIIDNFLQIDTPKIVPSAKTNEEKTKLNSALDEVMDHEGEDLMSETLADIYIKQMHYDKAIGIYKKLGLKYPEKNVYFARRISDLEKLTN
ncbi:hypothetical protein [Carboxylicivirga marina]|uniref:Tetratricopeptide repeat protein n=1 Tax=Carboxylicivirga marina TaxID=2800988 RepID=A0ABS1HN30_9BACT|nr:hypothetical protein [Carboxylicivirga marina]MBK3519083.1 hypothetical protein [Carboxylicivirga marina]